VKTTVPWQGDDSLTDKTGEWALALRGGRMTTLGDDLRRGKKGWGALSSGEVWWHGAALTQGDNDYGF
jgi:hypothetical protein